MALPTVFIRVTNARAGRAQPDCLQSLKAQTYPRDRFTVYVNGATASSDADYMAFVSDDVRVDPGWLQALVSAAESHGASAVAGRILDADRRTVQFGGRDVSFVGLPSAASSRPALLYASRQSALVRRTALIEAGGFDATLADSLGDVDLGWRLNLLGHAVVLASDATAYRATDVPLPEGLAARRQRVVERSALAMIFKNYDDRTLERVFPAAVALSLFRGLIGSGIDSLALDLSSTPEEIVQVAPRLIAHLIALEDFTRQLPALKRQRESVQRRRRVADADILPLFGDALRLDGDSRYQALGKTLIHDLGIDRVFEPHRHRGTPTALVGHSASRVDAPNPAAASADPLPQISIVILTAIGPTHLPECLESLRKQTYAADRIEVIIVDNGSPQDPTAEAQRGYPGSRVILNGTNLGFARGNNVGANAATGDYLVFLNDDTRVEPTWLEEMLATAARQHAAAVASFIVDWSGTRVDFVDGAVSFEGKGFQLRYDDEIQAVALHERPLLFGCGCALLIDRAVFSDAGGWDEGTFAYYEDVELGWRLNLLGHHVWFSPASVVYHKHHGTSGKWPEPPRLRLYERNSLRLLYALLDQELLRRALPAALMLAADRALLGTPFSRVHDRTVHDDRSIARRFAPGHLLGAAKAALRARGVGRKTGIIRAGRSVGVRGGLSVIREVLFPRRPEPGLRSAYDLEGEDTAAPVTDTEPLPIAAAAALSGVFAFLSDLPEVSSRRASIQVRRAITDGDVLSRFGTHWLQVCPAPFQAEHDTFHATIAEHFQLATPGARTNA